MKGEVGSGRLGRAQSSPHGCCHAQRRTHRPHTSCPAQPSRPIASTIDSQGDRGLPIELDHLVPAFLVRKDRPLPIRPRTICPSQSRNSPTSSSVGTSGTLSTSLLLLPMMVYTRRSSWKNGLICLCCIRAPVASWLQAISVEGSLGQTVHTASRSP